MKDDTMNRESELFEKQISRIYRLLENEKSIVTWNDKVYGEADPTRKRQVDVTIKRDSMLIYVECRLHKEPQDVQWIEQLIGKRTNLNPDILIAVSSSGFSKGAILTAKKHGILLRDLLTLTDDEIRNWGLLTTAYIGYLLYSDIEIYVVLDEKAKKKVTIEKIIDLFQSKNLFLDILEKKSIRKTRYKRKTH